MRGKIKSLVSAVAVFLLVSTAASPAVLAATGSTKAPTPQNSTTAPSTEPLGPFDFTVIPSAQALEVSPGGKLTTTIRIQNQGLATEHVKVSLYSFGAEGIDGVPQLIKPTPQDEFIKWASFNKTQFDAPPGVYVPVTMTIAPPKTAAFGYYYAAVFSRAGQATPEQGTAKLLGSIASLVLLNVKAPGAIQKVDIAEFSTSKKATEFLPADFTVRMHNTGNVHVAPRGNIFISRGRTTVATLEVNVGRGMVLPNSYRVFHLSWNDGWPAYKQVTGKDGKKHTHLDWGGFNLGKLRIGRYTAQLAMIYDNGKTGETTEQAKLTFWIIPWRILLAVLLVVLLLGAGLWSTIIRPLRRRGGGPRRGSYRVR